MQLGRPGAARAEAGHSPPIGAVLNDPRVAVAVRYVDVSGGCEGDVRWHVEALVVRPATPVVPSDNVNVPSRSQRVTS